MTRDPCYCDEEVASASKQPLDLFFAQNPSLAIPVVIYGDVTLFESPTVTPPEQRWEDE